MDGNRYDWGELRTGGELRIETVIPPLTDTALAQSLHFFQREPLPRTLLRLS